MKFRKEIKFILNHNEVLSLRKSLLLNGYKKIYGDRKINNIYLDNLSLNSFSENIDGLSSRVKYRIRFYNNIEIEKFIFFEKKIKCDYHNRKETIKIPNPYNNKKNPNLVLDVKKYLHLKHRNFYLQNELFLKENFLENSYSREYFYNSLTKIRITIDSKIQYFSPKTTLKIKESNYIIEKKIEDVEFISKSKIIMKNPTRHSKYINGLKVTNNFKENF
jgi:hypothetical protein